jgi:xylulokinase
MPDPRLVLAIDHGTSGVRTALITTTGEVLAWVNRDTPTTHTSDGGVEQDPMLWWRAFVEGAEELLAQDPGATARIVAVAVSSTFSTTVACDGQGAPVAPALTWMDARGAPWVRALMGGRVGFQGYGIGKALRWVRLTGGAPTLSGKDDLAHLLFWKHERPETYRQARWFLSSKDWWNLRLCGRAAASFDSNTLFWLTDNRDAAAVRYHPGLARSAGVELGRLAPLVPAPTVLGPILPAVATALGIPPETPVVAGSADLQSACIGSGAVRDFQAHLYLGTSSWLLCHVPFDRTDPLHAIASLPSSIPGRWFAANEQDMAGGCIDWLVRRVLYPPGPLGRGDPPADLHERLEAALRATEPGAGRPIFTPWLNGEKTPVDDQLLRGGFHNLSMTTSLEQLVRAVYEGVALNTRWLMGHLERFVGRRLDPVRAIGGGARSDAWLQIYADVLDRPILRVTQPRMANARGAALIAGVAMGDIDFHAIPELVPVDARFEPRAAHRETYAQLFEAFRDLHKGSRGVYHRLNG